MAGGSRKGIDIADIAPVKIGESQAQPVLIERSQDDVDKVGHQEIGPDHTFGPLAAFGQQIQIEGIIALLEKRLPAPIEPLGDEMRETRNHKASHAGHGMQNQH